MIHLEEILIVSGMVDVGEIIDLGVNPEIEL